HGTTYRTEPLAADPSAAANSAIAQSAMESSPTMGTNSKASLSASDERPTPADAELFSFLRRLDADELVGELEHERPQTLAVVVAHLPAGRSADLLSRLPSEARAEVLRRVAELGELDPMMVREVAQGLHRRLAQPAALRLRNRGHGAVATILKAADNDARDR